MATVKPIASKVIDLDDVFDAGYEGISLDQHGIVKAAKSTVDNDYVLKGTEAFSNEPEWDAHPTSGTIGTPLVFSWKKGTPPFNVIVGEPGNTVEHDNLTTNDRTYTLTTESGNPTGAWTVNVIDRVGKVLSQPVAMAAPAALAFSTNLAAKRDAVVGEAITLTVAVTGGTAPYTYAWKKAAAAVGSNSPSYNIPTAATGNSGNYSCVVTDAAGASITSTVCVVRVQAVTKKADVPAGVIGTPVSITTLFTLTDVLAADLTVTATNGGTVAAGNASVTPTASGATVVTAKVRTGPAATATITVP